MTSNDFQNGSIRSGHPLRVTGIDDEIFYFRSARHSPHSGTFLVCVQSDSGGILAVDVEDLSLIVDENE